MTLRWKRHSCGQYCATLVSGKLDTSQYRGVAFDTARAEDNVLGSSFNNPVHNRASDTINITSDKECAVFV